MTDGSLREKKQVSAWLSARLARTSLGYSIPPTPMVMTDGSLREKKPSIRFAFKEGWRDIHPSVIQYHRPPPPWLWQMEVWEKSTRFFYFSEADGTSVSVWPLIVDDKRRVSWMQNNAMMKLFGRVDKVTYRSRWKTRMCRCMRAFWLMTKRGSKLRHVLVPAPSDRQLLPSGIAFPSPSKSSLFFCLFVFSSPKHLY